MQYCAPGRTGVQVSTIPPGATAFEAIGRTTRDDGTDPPTGQAELDVSLRRR